MQTLYGNTPTVNETNDIGASVTNLEQAPTEANTTNLEQPATISGLENSIHDGMTADNATWDTGFQDAMITQDPTNGFQQQQQQQQLSQSAVAMLSNLSNNQAPQSSGRDELVFQAPVFPFNSDVLASNHIQDASNMQAAAIPPSEPSGVAPARGNGSRSSSPSDTDHEAALALEVRKAALLLSGRRIGLKCSSVTGYGFEQASCTAEDPHRRNTSVRL